MKGRKNLRRMGIVLGLGALLCAGVMASGALGMALVDPGSTDSTSTAADTSPASTDTSASSTDTGATSTDTSATSTDSSTSTDATTSTDSTTTETTTTTTTGSSSTFAPTIHSDQEDYNPGATVTLSGAGWGPSESVHIVVNDDKSQPWSYATNASADLSGGFSVQFQLPTSFAAAYTVQATGSSGRSATTSFTDGNVNIRVIGPTTATVTWARFATSNCTGAAAGSPSSGSISASDSGNGTAIPAGAGTGQSLQLTAAAASGFSFANWSGGNFAPSDPSTANPVCLAGDNNTQNTKLTYTGVQNQTITVTTHAPSSAAFNSSITVAATASSGLAVTYTSAGSCSNIGATFTMTSGTGTCTVKYDQPGNASFNPAPQVTESVTATKLNQTITFAALADKTFGDADFSVSASASSGLAVSFAASGNCTGAGATVHITAAGSCTITASQAGDGNYNAATAVQRTFTIGKAASTTTVTCGAGPFTYTGSAQTPCTASVSGAGGLNQSLTVSYTNNVNAGSATASASFAATANYLASSDSKNFTIGKAASTTTVTCGAGPFTYTGSAQTPCTASVSGAGGLNQSLTVSYTNNVNAGSATAKCAAADDAPVAGVSVRTSTTTPAARRRAGASQLVSGPVEQRTGFDDAGQRHRVLTELHDDRDLWCWSVYVYGVGADALYGVGEWCWWVESVVDGELHEQRECGFGDGECVVRCNCQLPGQQRFEELHDREGGSVDHVRSARRQDLR